MFVPVSAKKGTGIDELLEPCCCRPRCSNSPRRTPPPRGLVIEARLDKGRGPVASLLVQSGTCASGDVLLAGATFGIRVRAMLDENGKQIDEGRSVHPGRDPRPSDVPSARATEAIVLADEEGARNRALPPGQVPRRQARQAAGRQARDAVGADVRGRGQAWR